MRLQFTEVVILRTVKLESVLLLQSHRALLGAKRVVVLLQQFLAVFSEQLHFVRSLFVRQGTLVLVPYFSRQLAVLQLGVLVEEVAGDTGRDPEALD